MRVVVLGATGNIGTALLETLESASAVTSVLAVARRLPDQAAREAHGKVTWRQGDIGRDELDPYLVEADVVVHLAWLFQPTHRPDDTWANNVVGTGKEVKQGDKSIAMKMPCFCTHIEWLVQ